MTVTSIAIHGADLELCYTFMDSLFVGSLNRGYLESIIDTASRKVVQSFNLKLSDANRLKFTPDGKVLIVDGGTGTLVILDWKSRKEIKRLQVAPGDTGDGGIFVMPDGSRAYVGLRDDHSVAIVNLKTLEVEGRWAMGPDSGPGCIILAAAR